MKVKLSKSMLPCPFCGGKPRLYFAPNNQAAGIPCWSVCCEDCKTTIGTVKDGATDFFRTPVDAINTWNRRFNIPVDITVKEIENAD